jgi:hypothetical protein
MFQRTHCNGGGFFYLEKRGDPNRGATLGFVTPQSFFGFFYYIKSTLVECAKSDKSDKSDSTWVYFDTVCCNYFGLLLSNFINDKIFSRFSVYEQDFLLACFPKII